MKMAIEMAMVMARGVDRERWRDGVDERPGDGDG